MTDVPDEQIHTDLGVYLLGALEPAERARFERHLSQCSSCREELAHLAVLPTLLSRVGPLAADAAPPPDFGAVAARIAAERRRARWRERVLVAAAALAAVVAAVVVFAGPVIDRRPPALAFGTDDGAVTAMVEPKQWGMAVHIAARDLPPSSGYTAVAVAADGHRTTVATWSDTGRPVDVSGACYLDARQLAQVEIVDAADDTVVAVLEPG